MESKELIKITRNSSAVNEHDDSDAVNDADDIHLDPLKVIKTLKKMKTNKNRVDNAIDDEPHNLIDNENSQPRNADLSKAYNSLPNGLMKDVAYYLTSNSRLIKMTHYRTESEKMVIFKQFELIAINLKCLASVNSFIDGLIIDAYVVCRINRDE